MPINKENVAAITAKLQKEMTEALKEIEDVVVTASEAYAKLKVEARPEDIAIIAVDVALSNIKLPWYIPVPMVKAALVKTVMGFLTKKKE